MNIKILGGCCGNCEKLKKMTEEIIKEMGVTANIQKVEDIKIIMGYGVMSTPALVINEKVKVSGKVPSKDDVKRYFEEEM
jgi:small redox-active disulfide protein 2